MKRKELEHIIRAAGAIADVNELIILGSQSILGQFPDVSESLSESNASDMSVQIEQRGILIRSIEADIMVEDANEKAEMIEGAIGELSSFHNTFGYYAQAVDASTSVLPDGWRSRLTRICNDNTHGIAGLCIDAHDLVISKLYAGREKDRAFFNACVALKMISKETLSERLIITEMSDRRRRTIAGLIDRGFSE